MKQKCYDYGPIGERIKQARKAKGYTQEQVSNIIDINTKNISQLERGLVGLSVPTLIALCNALDISADYILFGENSGHQPNVISGLLAELPEKKRLQAEKLLEVFIEAYRD